METQIGKASNPPHPLMWIAAIAITLFCAAGIAVIMGWIPTSMGGANDNAALTKLEKPQTSTAKKPAAAKTQTAPVQMANNAPARVKCAECGVIESTREVNRAGEGSGLGVVGGAVVGGLLGNQIGGGRGNQAATVVGAVGGAVAGNQIEKSVKSAKSYEITVRFDDGSSRVITEANPPAWRTGDHVKVVDGVIRSN
ncbi:MAG: glycine zipper 2TM domain-containing protein [Burkholderiales bacterium]|nr:glycine zipper 2TM domain-containing protein [Burkholderiales bacterium]